MSELKSWVFVPQDERLASRTRQSFAGHNDLVGKLPSSHPLRQLFSDVTLEGDEVYTRVCENLPPKACEGWTIHFIERASLYRKGGTGRQQGDLFI